MAGVATAVARSHSPTEIRPAPAAAVNAGNSAVRSAMRTRRAASAGVNPAFTPNQWLSVR